MIYFCNIHIYICPNKIRLAENICNMILNTRYFCNCKKIMSHSIRITCSYMMFHFNDYLFEDFAFDIAINMKA
jgi:hypothetical protein